MFARGDDYVQKYRAETFLALSESIDLHAMDAALVRTPATLIAVREDQLVPFADMRASRRALDGPRQLIEIDSIFGHDAFLKEGAALTPIIKQAVSEPLDMTRKQRPRKSLATRCGARRPRIRCAVRLRGAADLFVDEFRVRRLSQAAQVRLHALGQSDARSARERARGSGRGRRRGGDLHGPGGDHADPGDACPPARACWRPTIAMAAPTGCWRPCTPRASSSSISSTRPTRRRSLRALAHKPQLVWIETPSNPLLRIVDIRAVADGGARGRRARGRGQHLSLAAVAAAARRWAPTWSCIRPPST